MYPDLLQNVPLCTDVNDPRSILTTWASPKRLCVVYVRRWARVGPKRQFNTASGVRLALRPLVAAAARRRTIPRASNRGRTPAITR